MGRPTITIAHDRFVVAAKAHARSLGMPALPLLIEPTPASGNIGINTAEVASRNIELVIAALTRPVDQVDQR